MTDDLGRAELNARLMERLADLARFLFPDGRQSGREWRARGPDGATWGVVLTGGRAGCWQNFGSGVGGEVPFSLIKEAACGGDFVATYRYARDWLGEAKTLPPPRPAPATLRPTKPKNDGRGLFLAAEPFAWGSPTGLYLQARGIDPAAFSRPFGALRHHPRCWCEEIQDFLPAMLAAVIDPVTRKQLTVHRTFLMCRSGVWGKATLETPKKVASGYKGGLIPLTRGPTGKPWGQASAGEGIGLAEGIENVLSVAQSEPQIRWAAYVSAANLVHVEIPKVFAYVALARDRDGENWATRDGRELAIGQWEDEGREVETWDPPEGVKDANDWTRSERAYRDAAGTARVLRQ